VNSMQNNIKINNMLHTPEVKQTDRSGVGGNNGRSPKRNP
jgi:hypothetical protein